MSESLSAFEAIKQRRAVQRFSARPVPDRLLFELLDLANRAPSGFNLQPWHFVLLRDAELRKLLHHICLGQVQALEAPVAVAFVADSRAWLGPYDQILKMSLAANTISQEYAQASRKKVRYTFATGPLGLFGFIKRLSLPLRRIAKPHAPLITSEQEAIHYARAQTMLAAATYMIAASGAGLATCPMEGFDEERLKKLLAIPRYMSVPAIVATGYAVEGDDVPESLRLPLVDKLSVDLFPNKLSKAKQKLGPEEGR